MRLKLLLCQRLQKLSIRPTALLSQPPKRLKPQLVVSDLHKSYRSRKLTSIAENDIGAEVASKVLAVLLTKPASVSTGTATIVSAPGSNPNTALVATTYPTTGLTGPTNSWPNLLPLSQKLQASLSKSRSHGAVTASKPTVSASSTTQAPGYGSLSQASVTPSISVTANNTGNGTTITSLPAGFSTFTASNSLWTSDTSTKINGTLFPVWYLGHHQGVVLAGLGGKPDDPVRPGCSGLFKSIFGCNTWIKFPPLGIFRISSDGVPVPQDKPSDPGEPSDESPGEPGNPGTNENPNDPEDENDTAQPTAHTQAKTNSMSGSHDSSMSSQSNSKTLTSAGTSTFKSITQTKRSITQTKSSITQTKTSVWHSNSETTASTRSIQSTLNTASRSTLPHSSTASTASATATSTNYIIQLKPAMSATQLEDITNDVKAHTMSTYTIALGSRPNDTVICAKLNPSSFAQFNTDPRVSSHPLLISQLVFHFEILNKFSFSLGLCGSCGSEGRPRTRPYYIASS